MSKTLEELIQALSPEQRERVRNYIESLVPHRSDRPRRQPQFTWAGAIKDLRDQYTSVDLQHEILRWRTRGE